MRKNEKDMINKKEADFGENILPAVRRRFAAEETLDDMRAMEIIAEEVFA